MNLKKIIFSLLLVSSLVFASMAITEAYTIHGYKLPSKSATYKWGDRIINGASGSSTIKPAWEAADTSWNIASNVIFSLNSSSVNTLSSWYEIDSNYYARAFVYPDSNAIVYKFNLDINAGNSNNYTTNVAKSSGVHEFGHALGINHNIGVSIMNSTRNRATIHTPQADDKAGINDIY